MRVFKGLLIAVLALAAVVIGVGLFVLKDEARFERSVVIASKPATVYTVLNGFRQFNNWSPWADLDPRAVYTMEGPPMGVGARSTWTSEDPNVGSGSQEILEATPYSRIRVKLVLSGFDADNQSTYLIEPAGEGSKLTWIYETDVKGSILGRYFALMLDQMIGPFYEKGLVKLKTLAESLPQDDLAAAPPELLEVKARPIAQLAGEAGPEQAAAVLGALYGRIGGFLQASGRTPVDAPIAITHEYDEVTRFWKFDAGLYIDAPCTPVTEGDGVRCGSSYGGWALKAQHKGPYSSSEQAYARIIAFKTVAGLQDAGDSWEHYVADPTTVPESEILTDVYWPVK